MVQYGRAGGAVLKKGKREESHGLGGKEPKRSVATGGVAIKCTSATALQELEGSLRDEEGVLVGHPASCRSDAAAGGGEGEGHLREAVQVL